MTLRDYYKYSWFSNMAYVEWDEFNTSNQVLMRNAANSARRIPGDPDSPVNTLGQEIFINQGWSVSSFQPNDTTGFAANIFSREGSNEKVLAIRGTEAGPGYPIQTLDDLILADLGEIGLMGLALEQAVSLFNYVQQLRADVTDTGVLRLELNVSTLPGLLPSPVPAGVQSISVNVAGATTYIWFDVYHDAQGLGILDESNQVTVTGHSLGGHLAALAARLFPDLIDQSVLFNAAGFDPITSFGLTDEIVGLFGSVLAAGQQALPALSFADIPIFNLQAEDSAPGDDTNLVASLLTGIPAGLVQDIRVENNSHSMDQMMDALGVLSLIEKLNPLLTVDRIFTLYDAMSGQSGATEETLLERLSRFFLFNDTKLEIVEAGLISHGDFSTRSANHERLLQLMAAIEGMGYVLESIVDQEAGQLVENAGNSPAYAYALKELNPYVITNADALYAAHNQNHALELYDRLNNPEGQLTGQFLEKRADFLVKLVRVNLEDIDAADVPGRITQKYFEDVDRDIRLIPAEYDPLLTERVVFGSDKMDVPDVLSGSARDDQLFGQNGDDVLDGGLGLDYLEGGEGNDTLIGLSTGRDDQDILNGGRGFDTYVPGLGDTIIDSDGQGIIFENGQAVNLATITPSADGSDVYTNHDADNPLRFKLLADNTLQVIGSYFTVQDFTNGSLGITLDPNAPIPPLNYIAGTVLDDRLGASGGIGGTVNADEIHGLAGDDEMDGMDGDDVMFGESGDDVLVGNLGHDVLDGGDGRDALLSGIGRDVLIGGPGDDFLSGFDQEDYLEGGAGNDFLAGGTETDSLLGGDGNDVLLGDGVYFVGDRTWQVTVTDTTPGLPGGKIIGFSGPVSGVIETRTAGDMPDYLDGGAGDDVLLGGGGNDQLYGGEDDDDIEGGAGDDYLDGGAGNDGLFGDSSGDPAIAGNDRLEGGAGDDYLVGGAGDDVLSGGDGVDHLFGGEGNDELHGDAGADVLIADGGDDSADGGEGDDEIAGGTGNDQLAGGLGNDHLFGGTGADVIDGGAGDDQLSGDEDDDRLYGGTGMDILAGGDGNDFLSGGDDDDILAGHMGNDELHGDAGNDNVQGNEGNDLLYGEDGDDLLFGQAGDDQVFGGTGNDQLVGDTGNDILAGDDGDDVLWGMDGNDTLDGGSGDDRIFGDSGSDILSGADGDDELSGGSEDDVLSGGAGHDLLLGEAGDDILDGGDGNDRLVGADGNDTLHGGEGADHLSGDDGDDILDGGAGNDVLQGGIGNDTYHFGRNYGQDTITDVDATSGNTDTVLIAPDVLPADVTLQRGSGLVLRINDSTDQLVINNYFVNEGASPALVERIQFLSDGTVWDVNTVKLMVLSGTGEDDTLTGYASDDVINGLGGDDTLYGAAGNDSLTGGNGNDTLYGQEGNDVLDGRGAIFPTDQNDADFLVGGTGDDLYLFGRYSSTDRIWDNYGAATAGGFDTIELDADIMPGDVTVRRGGTGTTLLLYLNNAPVQLWVDEYFSNDGYNGNSIEQILFSSDGTIWDIETIKARVLIPTEGNDLLFGYSTDDIIYGLGGNDGIRGGDGDDVLDGGTGNDGLFGEGGNDTYLFFRGSGQDTIVNYEFDTPGSIDTLKFASDILPSQITATRESGHLVLTLTGTADEVRIRDYFSGNQAVVERIEFSDGTVWTEGTIAAMFPLNGTSGNDVIQGLSMSEYINGLDGDDVLRGGDGNDTIDGGPGADIIQGEAGNDYLYAGQADGSIDRLYGGAGNDVLVSSGDKTLEYLYGESGNDIYMGGAGRDWMEDTSGSNLLYAGDNIDDLWGGNNNDLYIGGGGADFIDGDRDNNGITGQDILFFNRGDKSDTLNRLGGATALSLGGGIMYNQLKLERNGTALVLKLGHNEAINFNDWYGDEQTGSHVKYLQIVIDGTRAYDPASSDPLENHKVVVFDFEALVAAFDVAREADQRFNVGSNLSQYYLWGSDDMAYGGTLAYEYATNSNLDNVSIAEIQNLVGDPAFGVAPQTVLTPSTPFTADIGMNAVPAATPYILNTAAYTTGRKQSFIGLQGISWSGMRAGYGFRFLENYESSELTVMNKTAEQLVHSMAGFNAGPGFNNLTSTHFDIEDAVPNLAASLQLAA